MDFVTDAGEPSRHIGGIGAKPSRVCLTRVLGGEIKDLELALGGGADGPILVRTGDRPCGLIPFLASMFAGHDDRTSMGSSGPSPL
jgi:hypothetical protein